MLLEISSVELYNVALHIAKQLEGYYVNNIYAISSDSLLFRLHHPVIVEKQLVISPSRGVWLTKYVSDGRSSEGLVKILRTNLERAKFVRISQPAGERIAILEFETPNGIMKVIGEFFGGGNVILADGSEKIIACQKTIRVRHRRIVPGETYKLPPSKGVDFFHIEPDDILKAKESSLEVSRWLGREVSLSRKYVEEILARAKVDKMAKASDLSPADLEGIYHACKELAGILLDTSLKGLVILDNSNPVDYILPNFATYQGKTFVEKDSFADAIDEALSFDLRQEREVSAKKPQLQKIEELEKSLEEQRKTREAGLAAAAKIRDVANQIVQKWGTQPINIDDFQPISSETVKLTESMGKVLLKFGDDSLELTQGISGMKVSSKLFNEAKRLESKAKLIEQAEAKLAEQKSKILLQVQKEESGKLAVRKEPLWFERYRWTKTSEGLLAIGGRDAHSNTAIIRKHLSSNDIVLHAEIIGSPFFVIKDASEANMQSINEVAKAVVSYSRAWREGIRATDAYWVKPEQVKLQAPTGMFLAKGSFLIEGKKNYIKSIELELAVGACRVEGRDTLMGGPLEAVIKNCDAYVVLAPENVKATDTAKKVKANIIALLDEEKANIFKHIPLDDFVRVLPSGGGKVIGKGRGEQKD